MGLFSKVFGTRSQREVKALGATVDKIEALEEEYRALSDHDLRAKTDAFKSRLEQGETLDAILPEAFAVCREEDDADFHMLLAQLTGQLRLLAEMEEFSLRNVL